MKKNLFLLLVLVLSLSFSFSSCKKEINPIGYLEGKVWGDETGLIGFSESESVLITYQLKYTSEPDTVDYYPLIWWDEYAYYLYPFKTDIKILGKNKFQLYSDIFEISYPEPDLLMLFDISRSETFYYSRNPAVEEAIKKSKL